MNAKATISGGTSDIDAVVEESAEIFKKFKAAVKSRGGKVTDEDCHEIIRELSAAHKDFHAAYSFVMYNMANGDYDKNVFRQYLQYVKRAPWKSDDEYLLSIAEYSKRIFKHSNPKATSSECRKHKKSIYNSLKAETESFKEQFEAAKENAELINEIRLEELKKETELFLRAYPGGAIPDKIEPTPAVHILAPAVDISAASQRPVLLGELDIGERVEITGIQPV